MEIEQIGIGQLHWSTANYAPLQERALWDGLVAMYDKVTSLILIYETGRLLELLKLIFLITIVY